MPVNAISINPHRTPTYTIYIPINYELWLVYTCTATVSSLAAADALSGALVSEWTGPCDWSIFWHPFGPIVGFSNCAKLFKCKWRYSLCTSVGQLTCLTSQVIRGVGVYILQKLLILSSTEKYLMRLWVSSYRTYNGILHLIKQQCISIKILDESSYVVWKQKNCGLLSPSHYQII